MTIAELISAHKDCIVDVKIDGTDVWVWYLDCYGTNNHLFIGGMLTEYPDVVRAAELAADRADRLALITKSRLMDIVTWHPPVEKPLADKLRVENDTNWMKWHDLMEGPLL